MPPKPQSKTTRLQTAEADGLNPNFYALSFPSQMVIWAIRKQLHVLVNNQPDTGEVLSVFHIAGWGTIYECILAVVESLANAQTQTPLATHAISCPKLAAHEVSLLNAIGCLRQRRRFEAAIQLCASLDPGCAQALYPHLRAISDAFEAHGFAAECIGRTESFKPHSEPIAGESIH